MKTYVSAKLHGCCVTDKSVDYFGSVSIGSELMESANISPFEQVHIINLTNGLRWVTYALPSEPGTFTLNGGGARLGEIGDRCVIITYSQSDSFMGAKAVFCDQQNHITNILDYENIGVG